MAEEDLCCLAELIASRRVRRVCAGGRQRAAVVHGVPRGAFLTLPSLTATAPPQTMPDGAWPVLSFNRLSLYLQPRNLIMELNCSGPGTVPLSLSGWLSHSGPHSSPRRACIHPSIHPSILLGAESKSKSGPFCPSMQCNGFREICGSTSDPELAFNYSMPKIRIGYARKFPPPLFLLLSL